MRIFGIIFLLGTLSVVAGSQVTLQDDEDNQSWNDLQLTVPLSKQMDVFTKFTIRVGDNFTQATDGRIAFGYVWKPIKGLSISPFYWYIKARNAVGRFRVENRLSLSASYRFETKKKIGITHRSTYEKRYRTPVVSWRYRALFSIDKPLPKRIMSNTRWTIADEIFYDSLTHRVSRNRFGVGITKTFSKHLSLDLLYTRQNDGVAHPGDLNIFWTGWKVRF